jgi:hypothetical protein
VREFSGMAERCSRRVRLEAEVAGLDRSDRDMMSRAETHDRQAGGGGLLEPKPGRPAVTGATRRSAFPPAHQALSSTPVSSAWRFGTVSPTVCHLHTVWQVREDTAVWMGPCGPFESSECGDVDAPLATCACFRWNRLNLRR